MKTEKSFFSSIKWIFEVSRRFARIDRKGRSAAASLLSGLGICFGVMTLITVVSVMNGFQFFSINPIMEISSAHLRATEIPESQFTDFFDFCAENPRILCITPFYESQGLVVGARNRQSAAVIRAVDPEIREIDSGFGSQVRIVSGKFNLDYPDGIVLGKSLANQLGVTVGSTVNLMALSGGKDVALLSRNRKFTVTGLFDCNFVDIEQSYGFVSLKSAEKYFGKDASPVYSIKLKNYENDAAVLSEIERKFPDVKVQSWREFNKSFFGALRIEKNILMLLVCIIFLVVGINIYNGMRRLVIVGRCIGIFGAGRLFALSPGAAAWLCARIQLYDAVCVRKPSYCADSFPADCSADLRPAAAACRIWNAAGTVGAAQAAVRAELFLGQRRYFGGADAFCRRTDCSVLCASTLVPARPVGACLS